MLNAASAMKKGKNRMYRGRLKITRRRMNGARGRGLFASVLSKKGNNTGGQRQSGGSDRASRTPKQTASRSAKRLSDKANN